MLIGLRLRKRTKSNCDFPGGEVTARHAKDVATGTKTQHVPGALNPPSHLLHLLLFIGGAIHEANVTVHDVQCCDWVHHCYMTEDVKGDTPGHRQSPEPSGIADSYCLHQIGGTIGKYIRLADQFGFEVATEDLKDQFKFGASSLYTSLFTLKAWLRLAVGSLLCGFNRSM